MARPRNPHGQKPRVTFRGESQLLRDLRKLAKADNRALANYIEKTLKDHRDAKLGKHPPGESEAAESA